MNNEIPEIIPRLTPETIKSAEKVGSGSDLRNLVKFFRLFGVFGRKNNSNQMIARRIYKTRKKQERQGDGKIVEIINDTYAVNRFDNVIRGDKPISIDELEFFRLCIRKAFGDNVGAKVNDDEICNGQAHLLIRRLLAEAPAIEWSRIDPMQALQALAITSEPSLSIEFESYGSNYRMVEMDDGYEAEFPSPDILALKPGDLFKLFVPYEQSPTKPLVINFASTTGVTEKSKIDMRAQILDHVTRMEDKTGPWRISEKSNKPLKIGKKSIGHFGFLIISGVGRSFDQLFPDDFDPKAINNDDLKYLYDALAQISASGDTPRMGVLLYEVHA